VATATAPERVFSAPVGERKRLVATVRRRRPWGGDAFFAAPALCSPFERSGDLMTTEGDVGRVRLPVRLIQPLVENSIRHGVAPVDRLAHARCVEPRAGS
jgi:hypothetical protein